MNLKKGYFCFIASRVFSPTYSVGAPNNILKDSLANQDGVKEEALMVGNHPNNVASSLIVITNNKLELNFGKEKLLKFLLNSAIEMQKLLDSIFMHCTNFVENELLTNIFNENLLTQIDLSVNFGLSIINSKLKSYEKKVNLEKGLRKYYDNNTEEKEILLIESIIVATISELEISISNTKKGRCISRIINLITTQYESVAREILSTIKTVEKLSKESASILSVKEQIKLLEAQIKHIKHIITEKNKEIEM
ncbi:hypothetical protein RS030_4498 [Cryptosporidium xiaoi]|uniref:Uncharacterized protein n=1 Tax=Cryptosporidium xiaoi TaxID=659607 RepID=A0AAV9XV88_9CRYT